MRKRFHLAALSLPCLTGANAASAQSFAGGQIRFVAGSEAGGGYDTLARVVAPALPKHLPGKPVFIIQNMPGTN